MHGVQHQKPDPSKDQYTFDVVRFDANEQEVGKAEGAVAG